MVAVRSRRSRRRRFEPADFVHFGQSVGPVGDEKHRAPRGGGQQIAGDRRRGGLVEVFGGFVEDEDSGRGQQDPRPGPAAVAGRRRPGTHLRRPLWTVRPAGGRPSRGSGRRPARLAVRPRSRWAGRSAGSPRSWCRTGARRRPAVRRGSVPRPRSGRAGRPRPGWPGPGPDPGNAPAAPRPCSCRPRSVRPGPPARPAPGPGRSCAERPVWTPASGRSPRPGAAAPAGPGRAGRVGVALFPLAAGGGRSGRVPATGGGLAVGPDRVPAPDGRAGRTPAAARPGRWPPVRRRRAGR